MATNWEILRIEREIKQRKPQLIQFEIVGMDKVISVVRDKWNNDSFSLEPQDLLPQSVIEEFEADALESRFNKTLYFAIENGKLVCKVNECGYIDYDDGDYDYVYDFYPFGYEWELREVSRHDIEEVS